MFIFDTVNRLIIISIDITEISIQELITAIRDWEDEFEALDDPQVANAYGKQDLGAGTAVGITLELINNWRIKFEDRTEPDNVLCKIYGGNLVTINDYGNNPIRPSNYVNVIIAQSTSASIITGASEENINKIKQIISGRWE